MFLMLNDESRFLFLIAIRLECLSKKKWNAKPSRKTKYDLQPH